MSWLRRLPEAPVTAALIVVNLLVYAAMVVSSGELAFFSGPTLAHAGAVIAGPGVPIMPWRWLTAAFIHVHAVHILLNLWVLAQIGVLSERAIGRGFFAAAYVVTGVTGNMLSTAVAAARGRPLLSAGASGSIMGLIGLATVFAWLIGERRIARVLAYNVLFVLGLGFLVSARGLVGVDNAAHIGGLVVGAGLGALRARFPGPAPRWLNGVLIGAAAVATAVAFVLVHMHEPLFDVAGAGS